MILDCMWCCGIVSILFLRRTFPTFGKIISKDFVEAIKWRGLHFRGMCKVPARITKVQKQRELQRSRTLMTIMTTWFSGWFGISCVKAWLFTLSRLYYRWTFIRVLLSSLEAAAADWSFFISPNLTLDTQYNPTAAPGSEEQIENKPVVPLKMEISRSYQLIESGTSCQW